MKTLLQFPKALAEKSQQLLLGVITRTQRHKIAEVIAAMALNGDFSVVSGSARLPTFAVATLLDDDTSLPNELFDQFHLRRAFNCYQLVDILKTTPSIPQPLLVVNFLHGFYDKDVKIDLRINRFNQCITQLERLAACRPIGMIIQASEGLEYPLFFPTIERIADEIFQTKDEPEVVSLARLF